MTDVIRAVSPAPSAPVSFLYPKQTIGLGEPVRTDGKPCHAEDAGGAYWRVTTLVDDGDEFELVGGLPAFVPAHPFPVMPFAALRVSLEDEDGVSVYQPMTAVREPTKGHLAQFAAGIGPHVSIFGTWYPALRAGVGRIVLRNGIIDETGRIPVRDLRGRLRIWHGQTQLLDLPAQVHHFGTMWSYRVSMTTDEDGKVIAASLQREDWPEATVEVPVSVYSELGLLPRYHESVREDARGRPSVRWPMELGQSILWPEGGSSGGGKPTLAPLPQHDLLALYNPGERLQTARFAADRMPYPYFFTDARGEWISPQSHPHGWIDQNKYPDGRTLADFNGVRITADELSTAPYRTDVAHLPNPYVVPAILTGDPFYSWAATGMALGAAMQSRGQAGGWLDRATGKPIVPPPENTKNSRGPTGREGWTGREERAWGWGLWQRLYAADLEGDARVVDLARTCLAIARGHYLDDEIHPTDELRRWGFHCCPWWQESVWKDGHGRPPEVTLSDGSAAYVHPRNAVHPDRVKAAHAGWQDAFMVMAIRKAADRYGDMPGLFWIADLAFVASSFRRDLAEQGLPVTEYVWPLRSEDGWLTPTEMLAAWIHPGDTVPEGGRAISVDENGLNTQRAYVGYHAVGFANPMALNGYADVVTQIAPEWRMG